jgi:hypothetical protein
VLSAPYSPPSSDQTHTRHSSLPSASLVDRALAVLTSASSDEEISESLLDIFGFDRIELVGDAISRRSSIKEEARIRDESVGLISCLPPGLSLSSPSELYVNNGKSPSLPLSLSVHCRRIKTNLGLLLLLLFPSAMNNSVQTAAGRHVYINLKHKS